MRNVMSQPLQYIPWYSGSLAESSPGSFESDGPLSLSRIAHMRQCSIYSIALVHYSCNLLYYSG